jgi:hypothetical protein
LIGRDARSTNRPQICQQAFGEALNTHKLEWSGHYEVHLGRKFERMLCHGAAPKEPAAGTVEG